MMPWGMFGFFWLWGLVGLALVIWALVDCLKVVDDRDYQSGTKLVWVLVIILLWGIGAVLYLVIGRPKPGVGGPGAGRTPPTVPPAAPGEVPPPPPPPPGN